VRVGSGHLVHGPKILADRDVAVNEPPLETPGIPPAFGCGRENRSVKKAAKRTLGVGVVAGLAYGAWRAYRARIVKPAHDTTHDTTWEAAPFPFPPIPRPAAAKAPAVVAVEPWIEPVDGACPDSHPVKGKLASGIYHVAGGLNYARTRPDRCYFDPSAAEADGLRPAKR
jgi:hypothetical protein